MQFRKVPSVILALTVLVLTLPKTLASVVLFVGGASSASQGADAAVMSFLVERYGAANVTYLQASATSAGDEAPFDVLIISSTLGSGSVRGKFHDSSTPVVNWEEAVADNGAGEFSITTGRPKETENNHTLRITDATHPITAGFNNGELVQIASSSSELWWSTGAQAPAAISLATDDDTASNRFLSIVEQGGTLLNGSAAPARRVMFGMSDNTFNSFTPDGQTLFGQAIDWAAAASIVPEPPVITNSPAIDLAPSSATLGGVVTDTGGVAPTVTLYWGKHDGGTTPGNWDGSSDLGTQTNAFTTGVSGLDPATTYFFRCHALNTAGEDWADSSAMFTTGVPPNLPMIATLPASGISFTEAQLNGAVTSTGGESPEVIIYYGASDGGADLGEWDSSVAVGPQSGSFTNTLFFLSPNTTYFYRVFAQNSGGPTWAGASESFTTANYSPPGVATIAAANITGSAAKISGDVTSTGGDSPVITIYWGNEDGGTSPAAWDNSILLGPQSADFASTLSGLDTLTTYYFRAFAQNSVGVAWAPTGESFTTLEISELVLNEFMAANASTPVPGAVAGSFGDWIEIHNSGPASIDLAGWHLSDDSDDLGKWTFPAGASIAAGGYLVVFASGDGAPDANGNYHTNFSLSAGGERLFLVRPNGSLASEFEDYPAQDDDISYGLHPNTAESVFFASPSPGAANDPSGVARVADTKFGPDRGYYASEIDITITTDTPGASIYYTDNGTPPLNSNGTPSASATLYSGPVHLTQTTAIRSAAVKAGLDPTDVDTHTYILLDIDGASADGGDLGGLNLPLLEQTQPAGYGSLSSGDYNMDTAVTRETEISPGHPGSSVAQTMLKGMRDIPTISISMDKNDWAGGNGLYSNSGSRGAAWERPCSAEFIPAAGDTRADWQEDCGLRAQGGASRGPSASPKHSLSFRFRAQYGAGKLRQPLFPESEVEEFNVLALRAGYNNSWIHRDGGQRGRGSMIRDQWMRDCMLDMGNPAGGHGVMVHLFVNGLYWGVHDLCERQDAAHYAAYSGDDEDLIDARNGSQFTDGNSTAWSAMQSIVSGGDWSKIQQVIDIGTHIDYQIINRYGANADLKSGGNWRAAGGGPFPAGQAEQMAPWQLYSWDGERIFESKGSSTTPIDPMGVRNTLENHPEYQLLFADRLQKHFFNGGAMTAEACKERWMKRANELDRAIIAESARWGDHRRSGNAYTRASEWLTEQTRLYNSYFFAPGDASGNRSEIVLDRYRASNLFPDVAAPVFSVNGGPMHGGVIDPSDPVSLSVSTGDIYYTLDGSDPRMPASGGGDGGNSTILLDEGAIASAFVPSSDIGTSWRNTGFNDSAWQAGTTGVGYDYGDLTGLDVSTMRNNNGSAFVRLEFTIPDQAALDAIEALTLNMKYDDGFAAWLNGDAQIVASANSPTNPQWDSFASSNHSDADAVNFIPFNLGAHIGKLVVGSNVLALQGMNNTIGSSDLLITPQLVASDAPQVGGGGISPNAILYDGPFTVPASGIVRMRGLFNAGSDWTALDEATFFIEPPAAQSDLRITELHYHSPGGDLDFVEIQNVATHTVGLSGVCFAAGIDFEFGIKALAPAAFVVIAEDPAAFEDYFGFAPAGQYSGQLDNGGERIQILGAAAQLIQEFTFGDSGNWPNRADGSGSSLEVLDSAGDYNDPNNWRSSIEYNGSPAIAGDGSDGRIVVNELLTHTDLPTRDTIELLNTTSTEIDLEGWYLSDDKSNYKKYRIAGVTIPAGGYHLFTEVDFNDNNLGGEPFALDGAHGEDVWLLAADLEDHLSHFVDHVEFAAARSGESLGRWPNGAGSNSLVTLTTDTLGTHNAAAKSGPVILSAVMYHPDAPDESTLEYVEIQNTGLGSENLANWKLRGGVDFDFTAAHGLVGGDTLVIVGFDPVNQPAIDAAFRAFYGIDTSAPLVGPWRDGPLNNDTGTVRLQRPDDPPPGEPAFYPQVTEDEVIYLNLSPWPTAADGLGFALGRTAPIGFGNFATSWQAADPSPGGPSSGVDYAGWRDRIFGAGSPSGSRGQDDRDADGISNLVEFAFAMNPLVPDAENLPAASFDGTTLALEFSRHLQHIGITYQVQQSTDLTRWMDLSDTLISTSEGIETRRAVVAIGIGQQVFLRVEIATQ